MKQREIWYADLNPVRGSEQQGFRPVVIVSGDLLNTNLQVVIACPLTSKIKNYKGNTETNGLEKQSEIMIFHVRSISKSRLVKKIGSVSHVQLEALKQGLEDILRY